MAIEIKNSNYNGEVLEEILTVAATGNDLVKKGLIMIIPGVTDKISLPRLKTGKTLQKRKEMPDIGDSKGNFIYSEKALEPKTFMAFTTFNPHALEHIWRQWQPKGHLVFSELPPEIQNKMLSVLAKQVKFELGYHFINGTYGDDDDHLMNGILTQMAKDKECIIVDSEEETMVGKLKAVRRAIPTAIRENPNLRILMSITDWDKYDDELTEREGKNRSETEENVKRYKGITIETLAEWPEGLIVATLCSMDADGNLFAAVNLKDDPDVVQIERVSNAGELYFFKLLMMADTNIAFGENTIILDSREVPVFVNKNKTISADPTSVTIPPEGGSQEVTITASGEYEVGAAPAGFTVEETEKGIKISAEANATGSPKSKTVTLTLKSDKSKTATVTISQANQAG